MRQRLFWRAVLQALYFANSIAQALLEHDEADRASSDFLLPGLGYGFARECSSLFLSSGISQGFYTRSGDLPNSKRNISFASTPRSLKAIAVRCHFCWQ